MSLARAYESTKGESLRKGPPCGVEIVRERLGDEDRAFLDTLLDNPAETGAYIGRLLTKQGHPIAGTTVARHRRGDCACESR